MKKSNLLIFLIFVTLYSFGQNIVLDSIEFKKNIDFTYEALIIPAVLIGYGVVGLESHTLLSIDRATREEINEHIET